MKLLSAVTLTFLGNLECQNNGSCVVYDFGAYCYCPPGYTGELCQTRELEVLPLHAVCP